MDRRYAVLDVFTDQPLAGNPLAVVLDSGGLDSERMASIAREFNLPETVFVLPATNPMHSAKVRIFTPGAELPFAGHPTVGTAVYLAHQRLADGTSDDGETDAVMVLEEGVGPVRCGVKIRRGLGHTVFDAPLLPKSLGDPAGREAIAAALGLIPAEIGFENHHATAFDAGIPFTFVPLRDLGVAGKVAPAPGLWHDAFGSASPSNVYVYTRECAGAGHHFHGRMFAPDLGIAEDPATGAAAVAFAGVIGRFDGITAGSHRFVVEQGFEMGRPSLIELEVDIADGRIAAVRIGGNAVIVANGTLAL
jgi:trans-2,3-dihydro-3-hydroxyanthranilate isomerase